MVENYKRKISRKKETTLSTKKKVRFKTKRKQHLDQEKINKILTKKKKKVNKTSTKKKILPFFFYKFPPLWSRFLTKVPIFLCGASQ